MCIIPINKDIKTKQDVYFLVGSIINRQTRSFSKDRILALAKEYLRGSSFELSNKELSIIIDHELEILFRNGFICLSGHEYVNKSVLELA